MRVSFFFRISDIGCRVLGSGIGGGVFAVRKPLGYHLLGEATYFPVGFYSFSDGQSISNCQ